MVFDKFIGNNISFLLMSYLPPVNGVFHNLNKNIQINLHTNTHLKTRILYKHTTHYIYTAQIPSFILTCTWIYTHAYTKNTHIFLYMSAL